MSDLEKTRDQLIDELVGLRQRIAEMELNDIAERAQSEQALRRQALVFENLYDAVIVSDLEGRVIDWNPAAARMYGYSKEEMLGRTAEILNVPETLGSLTHRITEQVRRDGHWSGEIRFVCQDGTEGVSETLVFPLFDGRGERVALVGVNRDVTERKQAEEAMIHASRLEATATLAGGIAHDFNNLMVGVLGYADMLRMDLSGQEDAQEMLGAISRSAQRAGKLAQQMLAFARGGIYRPRAMDLNDTVQRVVSAREHALPSRIRTLLDVDPDLWTIHADPTQVSEVVLNLLTNAVEAIEDSGRITIATRNCALSAGDIAGLKPGPYVYLSVQDTGCGMSEEVQSRIFEPFFTTKFQGRGMGLAAVYGIVENHGGQISVRSQEGHGATFEIRLPAVEAKAELSSRKSMAGAREDVTAAKAGTILIVEHDESVLEITQRVAERLGYQVLVARCTQEAVEIARSFEGEIRLALLDIETPEVAEMDAYSLLTGSQPTTRVILFGSDELDAEVQTLLRAGASSFLQKPFRMPVLEEEMRRALG